MISNSKLTYHLHINNKNMILNKIIRFTYVPSIKFPKRVAEPSGKKVKLTNREALNLAMSEELDRDSRVFLIGE